jgi:pimeloyl-ACP methyl ester carboxylesterase
MDFFAGQGFDCWCCDHRGYGRSYKGPELLATIAEGADDLAAASRYIMGKSETGPLLVYGISSGALRAALFAERHPERVKRLALDDSIPNGTYIDMCENLPVNDPAKITVPTIIMRGQYDGIAAFADIVEFFSRLPNADKEFAVMPDIAHGSFTQMNYLRPYHILLSFFTRPEPVHRENAPAGEH